MQSGQARQLAQVHLRSITAGVVDLGSCVGLEPISSDHAEGLQSVAEEAAVAMPAGLGHPVSPMWGKEFCRWRQYAWTTGEAVTYAICVRGRIIGCLGVYDMDLHPRAGELSIWLASAWLRRGIGTRSVEQLIRRVLLPLGRREIYARHLVHNRPAQSFLERLGFRPDESWLPHEIHASGQPMHGMKRALTKARP